MCRHACARLFARGAGVGDEVPGRLGWEFGLSPRPRADLDKIERAGLRRFRARPHASAPPTAPIHPLAHARLAVALTWRETPALLLLPAPSAGQAPRDRRRVGFLPGRRRCGRTKQGAEQAEIAVARWRAELARAASTGQPPEHAARDGRSQLLIAPVSPAEVCFRSADRRGRDGPPAPAATRRLLDLYEYCIRVASAVGLMWFEIFGCHRSRLRQYAIDLGVALQLTNILRDVPGDLALGRRLPCRRKTSRDTRRHRRTICGRKPHRRVTA